MSWSCQRRTTSSGSSGRPIVSFASSNSKRSVWAQLIRWWPPRKVIDYSKSKSSKLNPICIFQACQETSSLNSFQRYVTTWHRTRVSLPNYSTGRASLAKSVIRLLSKRLRQSTDCFWKRMPLASITSRRRSALERSWRSKRARRLAGSVRQLSS